MQVRTCPVREGRRGFALLPERDAPFLDRVVFRSAPHGTELGMLSCRRWKEKRGPSRARRALHGSGVINLGFSGLQQLGEETGNPAQTTSPGCAPNRGPR